MPARDGEAKVAAKEAREEQRWPMLNEDGTQAYAFDTEGNQIEIWTGAEEPHGDFGGPVEVDEDGMYAAGTHTIGKYSGPFEDCDCACCTGKRVPLGVMLR